MYLLDTNIWLERMLGQEQSQIVGEMLRILPVQNMCVSDFTIHSIGVICTRLKQIDAFVKFIEDVVIDSQILVVTVSPVEISKVNEITVLFNLDFDDAYQYVCCEQEDATVISLDKDFDKTDKGRITPSEVIKHIKEKA